MANIKTELAATDFAGEIADDATTKERFSHDASMFELIPETVVFPKNTADVETLVQFVNQQRKKRNKAISITARSAGTCMSGGAIGESIVMSMTEHFNKIGTVSSTSAEVQPGVFYRDFEKATLKHNALMPSYPASRDLCSVGGMVANNAGGEKSLEYGKTENFVKELEVVFADGNTYTVKPLQGKALKDKLAQKDFEGRLYRKVFDLVDEHYDEIKAAKPKVTKDSTGYHLWNVWDRDTGVFDMTQLIVGSQGTLGLVTNITFKLVPAPKHSGTLVMFLRKTDDLGDIINEVLKHKPATFEGFDNYTLMLSFKLFFYFHTTLGWGGMFKLAIQLIPDALKLFRGIPKMVLLVEFNGETPDDVAQKVHALREELRGYSKQMLFEENETEAKSAKFWIMRRQSFNLLRKKVKDKHTAPFIDDLVVNPEHLPEFLPKLRKIVNKYKMLATVAGHMGDGNFHVIPLMKIEDPKERAKISPCMKEINELVLSYGGSLSGEHNDGMVRGPWLHQMYPAKIVRHFKDVKNIFDPDNIFNPHKKIDASWDYTMSHIREHF